MKKIISLLIVISMAIISFNCKKEIDNFSNSDNTQPAPITSSLQGNIIDENNRPVNGVNVKAGTITYTTNSNGYFRFDKVTLDKKSSLVVAEKDGYFRGIRTFAATNGLNQVSIKLIKKNLAGNINATTGGAVTLANGAKIILPPNGVIINSTGSIYSGDVRVYANYIDPTKNDIAEILPGSYLANDKTGKKVILKSFGMMAVELQNATGEKLQIASGKKAVITAPIAAGLNSSAPQNIPLWYLDENTGIWKEEGSANKVEGNYMGEVSHFSFWNYDISFPGINITTTLKYDNGNVAANVLVKISVNSSGIAGASAYGYTDSLGQVSAFVPVNETLVLEILSNCSDVIYSQNIGVLNSNGELGVITIPILNTNHLYTIFGKIVDCSNRPINNGYVIFRGDYKQNYIVHTDVNGNFSLTYIYCDQNDCTIIPVDITSALQGSTLSVSLTSNNIDLGNIIACGISSEQYINYTIDGINYTITENDKDSIGAGVGISSAYYINHIYGRNKITNNILRITFNSTSDVGMYPLKEIVVNDNLDLAPDCSVNIINYPKNIGDFYVGNFVGQYKETSNNLLHNISCNFRVRKYY